MQQRKTAPVRWFLGVVLVATVAMSAWSVRADAAPSQAEGECIEVLRSVYEPPETITPPAKPTDYGREGAVMVDLRFLTTYCFNDGKWTKTKDGFPYDSPDVCIDIYYHPDEHGGDEPPERVTPLSKIDDYGKVDASGGGLGTEFLETYCRDGSEWGRTPRDDDFPTGSYTQWSRECITIGPPIFSSPKRSTRHPRELGSTDFRQMIETLGPEDLKTYCLHKDRDVWYRVDDYPMSEILGDDASRLDNPENGTCVVMRQVNPGIDMDNLPEIIPGFGNPGDYGWAQEKQDFQEFNGGRDELIAKHAFCYANGAWRRADTLADICAQEPGTPPSKPSSAGLLPDQCWGAFPSSNYDIGYDSGSFWDFDFGGRLSGWWTGFFFDLGKGATQVSLWSIGWAYNFDISDYNQLGLIIGKDFDDNLVSNPQFRMFDIAWLVLFTWAGFNALRGKLSMAAGEIVMSIVLVGLSTVLMTNRAVYMDATWELMNKASTALMVAGQGKDPAADDSELNAVVKDVQKQIHGVFVEQPYDYLNWGHPLSGTCADARNEALALGPHEADPAPREMMKDANCDQEAEWNAKASGTRLLGAILSMTASFVVAFVLLAVSLTVVVAKFGALVLFALAPFAALAAVFPAGGRRLAWMWTTTLFQMVVAVVGMSFLLSLLLLGVRQLLAATNDIGLVERFFIVNLCVLVLAMARRRLLSGSQSSSGRLADNLTNMRIGGGGAPWQGPSGSAGANLLNIDRGMRYGSLAAGAAVAAGGRMISQRMRERRAWHNTLKARRRGDRMAGVSAKTYYSDMPGGSHGPGPRGGYRDGPSSPDPGPRPGPRPSGDTRPGPGPGPRPRPRPTGPGPGPGNRTDRGPSRAPTPAARAAAAAADGRTHDATYWGAVDSARNNYQADVRKASTPEAHARAKARYTAHVRGYGDRYEKATGSPPPMHPEPWVRSDGDGRRRDVRPGPGPVGRPRREGADTRQRQPVADRPVTPPVPTGRRLIHEVVVNETEPSWRYPISRLKDNFTNRTTRARGERLARRRNLR